MDRIARRLLKKYIMEEIFESNMLAWQVHTSSQIDRDLLEELLAHYVELFTH